MTIDGDDYVWLCLDVWADIPQGLIVPFDLSPDPSSVLSGDYLGQVTLDQMQEISSAVVNMYLHNQARIFASSGEGTAAYDFQAAAWHLIQGAYDGLWSGTLDSAKLGALAAHPDLDFIRNGKDGQLVTDDFTELMVSGGIYYSGAENWTLMYGVPSGNDWADMQPVIFLSAVSVPEPSVLLLSSLVATGCLVRRRRCS